MIVEGRTFFVRYFISEDLLWLGKMYTILYYQIFDDRNLKPNSIPSCTCTFYMWTLSIYKDWVYVKLVNNYFYILWNFYPSVCSNNTYLTLEYTPLEPCGLEHSVITSVSTCRVDGWSRWTGSVASSRRTREYVLCQFAEVCGRVNFILTILTRARLV